MRTRVVPSRSFARPMLSVDTRCRASRNSFSADSIASQRSSSGVRFHRSQLEQTTQSLPFAASNASRLPTGKVSKVSLVPSGLLQKRQVEYMRQVPGARSQVPEESEFALGAFCKVEA